MWRQENDRKVPTGVIMVDAEVAVTLMNRWSHYCFDGVPLNGIELLREGGLDFEFRCGHLEYGGGATVVPCESLVFSDGSQAMRIGSPCGSNWSCWSAFEPYV
jgi:hypothetical protein